MKSACPLGAFVVAFLLVLLNSGVVNSAIVKNRHGLPKPVAVVIPINQSGKKENITMQVFEEAVEDYFDLANAFYSPAVNETVREKRTLRIFRTLANRTRAGVKTLRNLFSGGRSSGSGSEDGVSTGRRFRTFFSNLLNRVLVFLTKLWDRFLGLFGRGGSMDESSSGSSTGIFGRIRAGAAGLVSRFTGGGSGGGGFLSNFLQPKTTIEPYAVDYSDDDSSSTAESINSVVDDETNSPSSTTSTEKFQEKTENYEKLEGGYGSSFSNSGSGSEIIGDNSASSSDGFSRFIPYPIDSDPNFHLNSAQSFYSSAQISNPWTKAQVRSDSAHSYYPSERERYYYSSD